MKIDADYHVCDDHQRDSFDIVQIVYGMVVDDENFREVPVWRCVLDTKLAIGYFVFRS
jgi:hypothetical protein